MPKSNICCHKDHRPIKSKESIDQKNSKAKKTHYLLITNSNNQSGNKGQLDQTLS